MGIEDSPLRDRVVFVEGAPRSGTTLLISLLAVHPEIAAIVGESHLFDRGVRSLFDTHEQADPDHTYLANYLSREELRNAVRDLCDRVLLTMRDRVKPEARLVAEKTPARKVGYAEALSRKLECYPDARYLHVVRERESVVRSLARAPWARGTEADFAEYWRSAVDTARATLDGRAGYLEIAYGDLAADPKRAMADVFEWLGVDHAGPMLERVSAMSRERLSTHPPGVERPPGDDGSQSASGRAAARKSSLARVGFAAARAIARHGSERGDRAVRVAQDVVMAAREGDRSRLAELTTDSIVFELRSGAGDLRAEGDEARDAILALASELFGRQLVAESWAATGDRSSACLLVAGVAGEGRRVDVTIAVLVQGSRAARVGVVSAGDPRGRVPRRWREEMAVAAEVSDGR
jgi:LPS sulfotransferase NodH